MIDDVKTIIIGTGALGSAIARRMKAIGYPITGIVSRSKSNADALATEVGAPGAFTLDDVLSDRLPSQVDLVLLCVPDDALHALVDLLAKIKDWHQVTIAHTSGALGADILEPLAARGANVMSFHPMQTFTQHAVSSFEGIYFGIEGDTEAVTFGYDFARILGGIPVSISSEAKTRYHLAASMASNLFVGLTSMACDILSSAGIDPKEAIKILHPLIHQTSLNMAANGPDEVLSGPGARGDLDTIILHNEALKEFFPAYRSTYLSLVKETINIASRTGRLLPEKTHQMMQQLNKIGLHAEE